MGAGEVRGGWGRNAGDVGSKTLNRGFGVACGVANTEGKEGPITGFLFCDKEKGKCSMLTLKLKDLIKQSSITNKDSWSIKRVEITS